MTDAGLQVVAFEIRPQLAAQIVRRDGLANRTDVVTLAFDGEQHGLADRGRINPMAVPFQFAQRQVMLPAVG